MTSLRKTFLETEEHVVALLIKQRSHAGNPIIRSLLPVELLVSVLSLICFSYGLDRFAEWKKPE